MALTRSRPSFESEVFAFGILLNQIWSLEMPFASAGSAECRVRILEGDRPAISARIPSGTSSHRLVLSLPKCVGMTSIYTMRRCSEIDWTMLGEIDINTTRHVDGLSGSQGSKRVTVKMWGNSTSLIGRPPRTIVWSDSCTILGFLEVISVVTFDNKDFLGGIIRTRMSHYTDFCHQHSRPVPSHSRLVWLSKNRMIRSHWSEARARPASDKADYWGPVGRHEIPCIHIVPTDTPTYHRTKNSSRCPSFSDAHNGYSRYRPIPVSNLVGLIAVEVPKFSLMAKENGFQVCGHNRSHQGVCENWYAEDRRKPKLKQFNHTYKENQINVLSKECLTNHVPPSHLLRDVQPI